MKRQTKSQKEAAAKAALLQRLMDIYAGANGSAIDQDDQCYADVICRVMCVCRDLFGNDNNSYLWGCHNVDEFGTPEKAVEHLYRHRIRA